MSGAITYVGHATVLVQLGGARLLTDPVFGGRAGPLRAVPRAHEPGWGRSIDAVLLSHLHRDHFDARTLRGLGDPLLIVPERAGARLRRRGFHRVTEVAPGDAVRVGAVTVEATPALHGRYPKRFRAPGCVGFVMRATSSIYFAGDTDLFPEMADIRAPLDAALLPIWGWGPTLGAGHLDPLRAAEALTLLRPRLAVPIHWGTFHPLGLGWLRPAYLRDPPVRFVEHARRLAPDVEVAVLGPGESLTLA